MTVHTVTQEEVEQATTNKDILDLRSQQPGLNIIQ